MVESEPITFALYDEQIANLMHSVEQIILGTMHTPYGLPVRIVETYVWMQEYGKWQCTIEISK